MSGSETRSCRRRETEEYPTLLGHARPSIRAYPREVVIAEKLHAMALLGEGNSRYKDYYDVVALSANFPFGGIPLVAAKDATFTRRRTAVTAALPPALCADHYRIPSRMVQWKAYLNRTGLGSAPSDFGAVGAAIRSFLAEPWDALAARRPFSRRWRPGGPWTEE
jgi:hypothetical protein